MSQIPGSTSVCPKCHASVPYKALDPRDCPPGTILRNRYLMGKLIGRGGFGGTYKALDLQSNQVVCIKEYFLKSTCIRDPNHPEMI